MCTNTSLVTVGHLCTVHVSGYLHEHHHKSWGQICVHNGVALFQSSVKEVPNSFEIIHVI